MMNDDELEISLEREKLNQEEAILRALFFIPEGRYGLTYQQILEDLDHENVPRVGFQKTMDALEQDDWIYQETYLGITYWNMTPEGRDWFYDIPTVSIAWSDETPDLRTRTRKTLVDYFRHPLP